MNYKAKKALSTLLAILMIFSTVFPVTAEPIIQASTEAANHVVISQVYGGGGNSGAVFTQDFIELYNPMDAAVDLSTYSIQYASSGESATFKAEKLTGEIAARGFYLIQCAAGSTPVADIPTPNAVTTLALAGKDGKVALSRGLEPITGIQDPNVVDYVAYGSGKPFEGTGAVKQLSNSTAARRINESIDTNDNKLDFEVVAPTPRAGSVAPITKCATPTADLPSGTYLAGSVVRLTTMTEGAEVAYNFESATADQWTTGTEVTLDASKTVYVKATKSDLETSDVLVLEYQVRAADIITIAEAKAAPLDTKDLVVQGVVTYINGSNVYIQDSSDAICLYLKAKATRLKVGDLVISMGTRADYGGLIELKDIYETTIIVQGSDQSLPEAIDVDLATIAHTPEGKTVAYDFMCETVKVKGVVLSISADAKTTTLLQDSTVVNTYPKVDVAKYTGIAYGDAVDATLRVSARSNAVQVEVLEMTKSAVEAPLIVTASHADVDVVTGATITLNVNDPKAKIYYTLDGTTPTESSSAYANGVKIEGEVGQKVTLTAIAKAEGKLDSTPFVSTYTIKVPEVAKTIKEVLALPKDTKVEVKGTISYFATSYGNPVLQSVIDGKTYALYVFGAGPTGAKIGDEVTLSGTYTIYNELPELISVTASKINGKGEAIAPYETTIQTLLSSGNQMLGQVVKLSGVTLGALDAKGNTTITQTIDGKTSTIALYKPTPYPVQVVAGDVVDVYAMVACYNTTIQLYTGTKEDNGFNIYDVVTDTKAPVITLPDQHLAAKPGQDYTVAVKVEDNKGIASVSLKYAIGNQDYKEFPMVYQPETQDYRFTISGQSILSTDTALAYTVVAKDVTNLISESSKITVVIDNAPQILSVLPARNGSTGDNKAPQVRVNLGNEGVNPQVKLTVKRDVATIVDQVSMTKEADPGQYAYALPLLEDGNYTAVVHVTRDDQATASTQWSFTVGTPKVKAYYGQLHAHTAQYSDGSGTLQDGLQYVANLPKSENVDFVSFTDHSNYFDTTAASNPPEALNDASKMTADSAKTWHQYAGDIASFNASQAGAVVALTGFEMTWSGGPGHINTFNSKGVISRNNKDLNNKTGDAGMKAYYETLIKNADPLANLSQFNHPGTTFGTFADFAYWSPAYDNKMVAVEVGNGEGAIGSGGYFASFNEYTKALDKGWHVAPTINQDNHKGKWGNANTGRTVIIAESLTNEGLLKGLKAMSVYATEDKNLQIEYAVNDQIMGSTIVEVPQGPLKFSVKVTDPDAGEVISKVDVVTNGGKTIATKSFASNAIQWDFDLPAVQGYFYLRVTQADKQLAVTAPVWVGQAPLVGLSALTVDTKLPVTDEAFTVTAKLFNNEQEAVTLKSLSFSMGDQVIAHNVLNSEIPTSTQIQQQLTHTFTKAGTYVVTATAVIVIKGEEKVFTEDVSIQVRDASKLVYVGIDASHNNEYVAGNYKDSMGNFANMAVDFDVRVVELKTSEALIAATKNPQYRMLILTPPTRRDGKQFLLNYKSYTDSEIEAVKAFAEQGNTVIITGWGDYYESYTEFTDKTPHVLPLDQHMAAQQNKLLEAMGASLRVSDDEIKDKTNNGGQEMRLYLKEYNMANPFLESVKPLEQVYSNYGGSTVHVVDAAGLPTAVLSEHVTPMVYAFETSYSADDDKTGTTAIPGVAVPKYNGKYMVAASEQVNFVNGKTATIIVAGSAFMSNFEIQVAMENYATPAYSNYTILENIVKFVNPVTISDIAKLHEAQAGESFTIQGLVTSNASGFDKDTAFFDCVYVQDLTGGINAFPVAGNIQKGQRVEIKGKVSAYNGERQIAVEKITVLEEAPQSLPQPQAVTIQEANATKYLGSLVQVEGLVSKIDVVNGAVESIFVRALGSEQDSETTRIFIDGYITQAKVIENLEVGAKIVAIGLQSIDTEGARIRIRDRADITCEKLVITPIGQIITPMQHINNDVQKEISVKLVMDQVKDLRALDILLGFDDNALVLKTVRVIDRPEAFLLQEVKEGKIHLIGGITGNLGDEDEVVIEFIFEPLQKVVNDTRVQVLNCTYTTSVDHQIQVMDFVNDVVVFSSVSYLQLSDINGDGILNISDLSIALGYYRERVGGEKWEMAQKSDINDDGVVDTTDFTIIATHLLKQ